MNTTITKKNKQMVYADFNNLDEKPNWIRLNCLGTIRDMKSWRIIPEEGRPITFYTDDMDDDKNTDNILIEGKFHYNSKSKQWVAILDWDTLRHESDEQRKSK
ncbi:hypothetical protein C4577_07440 [Candidatus Parcubacteria bacterium]|nr:MAG: hypothetical protein C4577_07440 [Candidatus Parcubacteria bacterium]